MACQEALKETNKVKRLFYFVKRALRCIASQQAKTGLPPQHEKPARAGGPGLLGAAAREPAAQGSCGGRGRQEARKKIKAGDSRGTYSKFSFGGFRVL